MAFLQGLGRGLSSLAANLTALQQDKLARERQAMLDARAGEMQQAQITNMQQLRAIQEAREARDAESERFGRLEKGVMSIAPGNAIGAAQAELMKQVENIPELAAMFETKQTPGTDIMPSMPLVSRRATLDEQSKMAQRDNATEQLKIAQGREARESTSFNEEKAARDRAIAAVTAGQTPNMADMLIAFNRTPDQMDTPEAKHKRDLEMANLNRRTQLDVANTYANRPAGGGAGSPSMSVGQAKVVADIGTLSKTIDDVVQLGDKLNWKGVGVIAGPLGDAGMSWFGVGNPEEAMLRSLMNNLKAEVAHEKYGSAFTAQERAMMQKFVADAGRHPNQAKVHLATLKRLMDHKLESIQEAAQMRTGRPVTAPTPAPAGRAGGAGPGGAPPPERPLFDASGKRIR